MADMDASEQTQRLRLLQAMASAYPNALDVHCLAMIFGVDTLSMRRMAHDLANSGLASISTNTPLDSDPRCEEITITAEGMVVASGMAASRTEAWEAIDRIETLALHALRQRRLEARAARMQARPRLSDAEPACQDEDAWAIAGGVQIRGLHIARVH